MPREANKTHLSIITTISFSDRSNIGVTNKLLSIKKAFKKFTIDSCLYYLRDNGIYRDQELIYKKDLSTELKRKWFVLNGFYQIISPTIPDNEIIYIRFSPFTFSMFRFLSSKNKNHCRILLEIPTFPYDREYQGLKGKLIMAMDRFFRKRIYKYVDYVIYPGTKEMIYGIPVIKILNSVSAYEVERRNKKLGKRDAINIIAVGKLWKYFGLDRIIKSYADYREEKIDYEDVRINIIGDGEELMVLINLVNQLELTDVVIFRGVVDGAELDKFYHNADLAVGRLAPHRIGIKEMSSLKHAEYCAKGIPFIYAGSDPGFSEDLPFVLNVTDNESPINFNDVLLFLSNISLTAKSVMIGYALSNLTWEKQVQKMVHQLKIPK